MIANENKIVLCFSERDNESMEIDGGNFDVALIRQKKKYKGKLKADGDLKDSTILSKEASKTEAGEKRKMLGDETSESPLKKSRGEEMFDSNMISVEAVNQPRREL